MKQIKWIAGMIFSAVLLMTVNIQAEENDNKAEKKTSTSFAVSGTVGLESAYQKNNYSDVSAEDDSASLFKGSIEIGVDANIEKNLMGHANFKWEEDDDTDALGVDEAFLKIGGSDNMPFYFKAGKMYVPFGKFETAMISDPLTLQIGETRETAAEAGFALSGFYGAVYAFNGNINRPGKNDVIDNYGASLGYGIEKEFFSFDAGCGYINNLFDSDGMTDIFAESQEEQSDLGNTLELNDYVPGMSAYAGLKIGGFSLYGEYLTALKDHKTKLTDSGSNVTISETSGISAWNIEAGYVFTAFGRETSLSIAYQGTSNAGSALPENRYMCSAGIKLMENLSAAVEYAHDKFETDDKADNITGKIEITF